MSIWPEYDDLAQLGYPSVLVILEGEIVSDDVPVTMRFLVPGDAVIYLTGSGPRDEYLEATPARKASNITGWDELSFELFTKYFVVEYYAPIIGQPDRVIPYDFYTLYPVSGLGDEVQEPRRSKSFSVSPEGLKRSDGRGFRYHTYEYANVSPDAPLHFDIGYTKTDSRPSLHWWLAKHHCPDCPGRHRSPYRSFHPGVQVFKIQTSACGYTLSAETGCPCLPTRKGIF